MFRLNAFKLLLALAFSLTLAGCDSAEERAEEHYQSGLALLEAGDRERAIVEFRNVFPLVGNHRGARQALAQIMLEMGNKQEAYSQYLRLVEQYPDDLEGRRVLAEIAFEVRNWDELERHGAAAEELAPDDPRVKAISLGRHYRQSVEDDDASARRDIARQAEELKADLPLNPILLNILIDNYSRNQEYDQAIVLIDEMIAAEPDNRAHHDKRLAILVALGDQEALEEQLKNMVTLFPQDDNVKTNLLRFYSSIQATDKAEAFLREISDPSDEDPGTLIALIRFLAQVRGVDVAREEIDRAIEQNPNPGAFRALRAGFVFADGDQDAAVAEMEDILKTAEPSDQTRGIKVNLARMLLTMGNEVGARSLIEEVLAEDASQVEALKIQAAWQIEADETDAAISGLRLALDKSPNDAQAMTLMAEAYNRAGSHDLARDFLALAVDASGNAPTETLRYARLLIQEGRYLPAEDILLPALRLDPQNVELLAVFGQL